MHMVLRATFVSLVHEIYRLHTHGSMETGIEEIQAEVSEHTTCLNLVTFLPVLQVKYRKSRARVLQCRERVWQVYGKGEREQEHGQSMAKQGERVQE